MGTYTVTVTTNTDPPCTATDSIYVAVVVATDNPVQHYQLTISPNPTSDIITIVGAGAPAALIQVVENTGKVLMEDRESAIDGIKRTMNLEALPAGLYYLRIVGAAFASVVPVVKSY